MDNCKQISMSLFVSGVFRYVVTTSLNNSPQTWAASPWPVDTGLKGVTAGMWEGAVCRLSVLDGCKEYGIQTDVNI